MSAYNPPVQPHYPPQQDYPPNFGAPYAGNPGPGMAQQPWNTETYVPPGARTILATLAIGSVSVLSFAVDISQLVFGAELKSDNPGMVAALATGLSGIGMLGMMVLSAIFFSLWIHRASKNLRGLNRNGMEYSPGWCVGWFYVPFANLFRPVRAMTELWRASEPDGEGDRWRMAMGTPMLGAWWGAYIGSNILSNISARIDDPVTSGTVGFIGSIVMAASAILCIMLMFGIDKRQEAAAAKLGQNAAAPPPYMPGGAPPYGGAPFQG